MLKKTAIILSAIILAYLAIGVMVYIVKNPDAGTGRIFLDIPRIITGQW